ncbi:MAG: hypothetical protein ACQETD_05435 [Pseudomonadota bacterium]
MAIYMTQSMSSGTLKKVTYYRKQKQVHPSHEESSAFTHDAKDDYAKSNDLNQSAVEEGTYRSGQGVPTGGKTKQI